MPARPPRHSIEPTRTSMPSSPQAPYAWQWSEVPAETKQHLSDTLRLDPARLREGLTDPRYIEEQLRELPEHCLVLIEILAECGGRTPRELLNAEMQRRTACTEQQVDRSVDLLCGRGLAVTLTASYPHRNPTKELPSLRLVALVEPTSELVAPRVRGVSAPLATSQGANPAPLTTDERLRWRDEIALLSLTAHRKIRFTLSRDVNRGGLRTFVKDLGVTEEVTEECLSRAMRSDVLGGVQDRAVPFASCLELLARRGPFRSADRKRLQGRLRDDDWTSVELLARLAVGKRLPAMGNTSALSMHTLFSIHQGVNRTKPNALVERAIEAICLAPFVECVEQQGTRWVRRRSATRPWNGDGHVTPSFDVLLGPGADADLVAVIGLGAELKRVDKMLTLRISPASVSEGLSCGLDPARFINALAHVSSRPLADNVRAMLTDWIGRARIARITETFLVELPAEVADALANGALKRWVMLRPSSTVMIFDRRVPQRLLEKELSTHRVLDGRVYPLDDAIARRAAAQREKGEPESDGQDPDQELADGIVASHRDAEAAEEYARQRDRGRHFGTYDEFDDFSDGAGRGTGTGDEITSCSGLGEADDSDSDSDGFEGNDDGFPDLDNDIGPPQQPTQPKPAGYGTLRWFDPDPRLRARVLAAIADGFAVSASRLAAPEKRTPASPASSASSQSPHLGWSGWGAELDRAVASAQTESIAPEITRALVITRHLWAQAWPSLEAWLQRFDDEQRRTIEGDLCATDVILWLTLPPKFQRRALGRARSVSKFIEACDEVAHRSSQLGNELDQLLSHPKSGPRVLDLLSRAAVAAVKQSPQGPAVRPGAGRAEEATSGTAEETTSGNLQAGIGHSPASQAQSTTPPDQAPTPAAGLVQPMQGASAVSFFESVAPGTPIRFHLRDQEDLYEAVFEGLQRRGDSIALLTADRETDEGRIVRITDVLGAATLTS